MATEVVLPNALTASTNFTGAYTDIDDDPDSPDANWLTVTSLGTNATVRVNFATPSAAPLTGSNLQQFRVYVREQSGNKTPDFNLSVYENGVSRATLVTAQSVTGTGTLYTYNWTYSGFTNADGSGVEAFFEAPNPHPGGGGVDLGAIEWIADVITPDLKTLSGIASANLKQWDKVAEASFKTWNSVIVNV